MDIWKPIYFEQGYEINEYGKVRNKVTGLILKTWYLKNGYEQIQIRKNVYTIHRLVAKVFHPLGEFIGAVVMHLDNDKKNNHYTNLRWSTQSDNIRHAYKTGRMSKTGINHHMTNLTDKIVLRIRKRRNDGLTYSKLSEEFGIKSGTLKAICLRENWKHI